MIIYLGKLTDDLLDLYRMMEGGSKVKTRLSEIAFDVSLLPKIAYGFFEREIELPQSRLETLQSYYD